MISILLTILKVIGIIILVLLGMIVFLLVLVLLHPVQYDVRGEIEEERYELNCRVSWLFRLLQYGVHVNKDGQTTELRIFGIRKKMRQDAEDAEEETASEEEMEVEEESSDKETSKKETSKKEITEKQPVKEEETVEEESQKSDSKESETEQVQKADSKELESEKIESEQTELEQNQLVKKVSEESQSEEQQASEKSAKKEYRSKNTEKKSKFGKLKSLYSQKDQFQKEFSDTRNRQALLHVWKELVYLFKHTKPRNKRAQLSYGTDDPALTGLLTGMLSMVPWIYEKNVQVLPDFTSDSWYVLGTFRIKGHLRLVHIVCIAFRLLRDKDIKRIRKKLGY